MLTPPDGQWIEEFGPTDPDFVELRFSMLDLFERYGETRVAMAFMATRFYRNREAEHE